MLYQNEKILNQCQIDINDYIYNGHWVGNGNKSCKDPKMLYKQAVFKPENFGIEKLMIKEFGSTPFLEYKANNLFKWSVAPYFSGSRHRESTYWSP